MGKWREHKVRAICKDPGQRQRQNQHQHQPRPPQQHQDQHQHQPHHQHRPWGKGGKQRVAGAGQLPRLRLRRAIRRTASGSRGTPIPPVELIPAPGFGEPTLRSGTSGHHSSREWLPSSALCELKSALQGQFDLSTVSAQPRCPYARDVDGGPAGVLPRRQISLPPTARSPREET